MDILALLTGLTSFGIFLLVHAVIFRRVVAEGILRSLSLSLVGALVIPMAMIYGFYIFKTTNLAVMAWIVAGIAAVIIQGLLCVVYVLCIFGPYETSVRMRLVRELSEAPAQGLSLKDILRGYNAEIMAQVRLSRLIGSGDIVEKDGVYHLARRGNLFFVFDAIAGILKKWIGR